MYLLGNLYEGKLTGKNMKIGIVVSRFNEFITRNLLQGAESTLLAQGVKREHIDIIWVPGAFEIPLAAQALAQKEAYDAVITLGVVIQGATSHFDYVCNEVAKGVSRVALDTCKPVVFGVLTTETIEQALERAGTTRGNKGAEVASAAIEMTNLIHLIKNE